MEMFQPLVPFITQHHTAATQLCNAIMARRESLPPLRSKQIKFIRMSKDITRPAKAKIADAWGHSPQHLEETLVACLEGKYESQYVHSKGFDMHRYSWDV